MVTLAKQSTRTPPGYNLDPEGRRATFDKVYLGFVRDRNDAGHMGRVKVWVPELCGPDQPETWIICDYCSPYGGVAQGTSYGHWFVPEVDANVLVTFINGDPNRGVYLGCMFPIDQHTTLPAGAPDRDTQLPSQERNPRQNQGGAQTDNPPGGGEQPLGSTQTRPPPRPATPMANGAALAYASASTDPSMQSGWGTDNSYNIFGIRTPGGNFIRLSDQSGDAGVHISTSSRMSVNLNSQTGKIIIINSDATARIEITNGGKLDLYSAGELSIRSATNLNLIGSNVNIQADNMLNLRAGKEGARMFSVGNFSVVAGQNLFLTSFGQQHRLSMDNIVDTSLTSIYRTTNGSMFDYARGNINWTTQGSIRGNSLNGAIDFKTTGNFNLQNDGDFNVFSKGSVKIMSTDGNTNIRSSQALRVTSDDKVEILGAVSVNIGFTTVINSGDVTPASLAIKATPAEVDMQLKAMTGEYPITRTETQPGGVLPDGGASGQAGGPGAGGAVYGQARDHTVISTVATRTPGGEPYVERYMQGPGYSGTGTVVRVDDYGKSFKTGQVDENQRAPLQVMGYVSNDAKIAPPNQYGLEYRIYEAVRGMRANYPKAVLTSTVRPGDSGQHGAARAVDFTLDQLSIQERIQLVNEIARDIESGTGYFRYVRGVGMYDPSGRLIHMDSRPRNASNVPNGMDVWGSNYSITGVAGSTPTWFAQAMKVSNTTIGLRPAAQIAADSPAGPPAGAPVDPGGQPMRYIGISYQGDQAVYNQEPVPQGTFKPAREYTGGALDGLSDIGLQEIKNFETLRGPWPADVPNRKFYHACAPRPASDGQLQPTSGITMIGYGHVLTEQEKSSNKIIIRSIETDISNGITEQQATDLLLQDLKPIVANVKEKIASALITQQQLDALVDFCFNIGQDKFNDPECKVVSLINEKKYDQIPAEMIKWCYACGDRRVQLVSRRRANCYRFSGNMRADTPALVQSRSAQSTPQARMDQERRVYCGIYNRFGRNHAVAAGFTANFFFETYGSMAYSPGARLDDGQNLGAVGLAQWRGVRVTRFNTPDGQGRTFGANEPLLNAAGKDSREWTERQMDYVAWEINSLSEYASIKNTLPTLNDPAGAARYIAINYERGNVATDARERKAIDLYEKYSVMDNPCGS